MWVKRLGSGSTANGWRHLIDNQFNNTSVFIFKCNLAPKDISQAKFNLDPFWQDVLYSWCEYNFNKQPVLDEAIIKQSIWYNSNIKQGKKVLSWKKMYKSKINTIENILCLDANISFMTNEEIVQKYGVELNFLDYMTLVNCIPSQWRRYIKNMINIVNNPNVVLFWYKFDKLLANDKGSRYIYNLLLEKVSKSPEKAILKWKRDLEVEERDVLQSFQYIYKVQYLLNFELSNLNFYIDVYL